MALFRSNQMGRATLVLTVLLGLSLTGDGFKQELWMYTADSNALYFQSHVPDLAKFSSTLPHITRVCGTGRWFFSSGVNYQTMYTTGGSGGNEPSCRALNATTVQSLRHMAANDTTTDAISLYSGNTWEGEEIFVATRAKTDISIPINSLAATGTSDWMLYEGKNFDGKSVCYKVPGSSSNEMNWGYVKSLNMTTIGSVFKGCDLYEIQVYKEFPLL